MKFAWPDSARAELRSIDRETAVRILPALTLFGDSGAGEMKALAGEWQAYSRLRAGDYRVIVNAEPDQITTRRVHHRSDGYR